VLFGRGALLGSGHDWQTSTQAGHTLAKHWRRKSDVGRELNFKNYEPNEYRL